VKRTQRPSDEDVETGRSNVSANAALMGSAPDRRRIMLPNGGSVNYRQSAAGSGSLGLASGAPDLPQNTNRVANL
jgi:hypothetical protein